MDCGAPTAATVDAGGLAAHAGADPRARHGAEAAGRPSLALGRALHQTVQHFWPEFRTWLDLLPDTRFAPFVDYDKRFLV